MLRILGEHAHHERECLLLANVLRVDARRILLSFTRVWLPLGIGVAGVVAIVIGHGSTGTAAAGVGLLIVALIVWMINWMFRMSVESNRDREREEEARDFFTRYGRWPDE